VCSFGVVLNSGAHEIIGDRHSCSSLPTYMRSDLSAQGEVYWSNHLSVLRFLINLSNQRRTRARCLSPQTRSRALSVLGFFCILSLSLGVIYKIVILCFVLSRSPQLLLQLNHDSRTLAGAAGTDWL
jgi:hypothetical protein